MEKVDIKNIWIPVISLCFLFFVGCSISVESKRSELLFTKNWKFNLGNVVDGQKKGLEDSDWRELDLPHDWSIEGEFDKDNRATPGGGALPGGIGWYRKEFKLEKTDQNKKIFIDFDGVYKNSEVWINEHYLGKRPNGYISFRYDITPYLTFGDSLNIIAVKVDNSKQPNSRWYSGSGIYRNVRIIKTEKVYVEQWGTYATAEEVSEKSAKVSINTTVKNDLEIACTLRVKNIIIDGEGNTVDENTVEKEVANNSSSEYTQSFIVKNPKLWSVDTPNLYSVLTKVYLNGKVIDNYKTAFGIRSFTFDAKDGFVLNGKKVKIKGVCNHHDLGCLGSAVNTRAIERQLEILKKMGCNGIRTSHNPPTPELLNLCDKMGFIVMDEVFDMWAKKKSKFDYSLDWEKWHEKDLRDFILRDRNHPSVFMWSIGNEITEQYDHKDSTGKVLADKLSRIVKELDNTRPVTAACNDASPDNPLLRSDGLDIVGYNYNHDKWADVINVFPGKPFIATETESSLHTRGSYDMPSDSVRNWPYSWDKAFLDGNKNNTCSAYDNCCAPWGSTHEATWKLVKKYDHISGMFTWTGFDYLGEPTPYTWPSRSSYFGLIDLAGFPKDAYYFYQSEWTEKPMLHIFPHWNWEPGQLIDIWGYTNCDEVELFLNDRSFGVKSKTEEKLHVEWPVNFEKGTLKAVGRINGKDAVIKEVKTAGAPFKIIMEAARSTINADGSDLAFITIKIADSTDIVNPLAGNLVNFKVEGPGIIAGVDNGLQTSHESFKAPFRSAFKGLCLVVIKSTNEKGIIKVSASSEGLRGAEISIKSVN
ncbi:MAG: DUF4982 domain-containing protein [Melioribacteraceae bacterium]|nr:DUF4982 domain-containing protein [Melioribacteraceae bacterium]